MSQCQAKGYSQFYNQYCTNTPIPIKSACMQNKFVKNAKVSKTSVQKVINAHQKAPLDYISPWQAHHHQLYLVQSQGNENLQNKSKSAADGRQNVVQSFLEKIRRTQQHYQKSRILRNRSTDDKDGFGISSNNNSLGNSGIIADMKGLRNDGIFKTETSWQTKDNLRQSKGTQSSNRSKNNVDDIRDIGFGKLHYTKTLQKQEISQDINKTQYISGALGKSKSFRFNKRFNTTHTQPMQSIEKNIQQGPTLNSQQSIGTKTVIRKNARHRMFTEQELSNPNQVVFIKKKKNNNNITVVDINSTAQEFYEEQIRYTELKMVEKYRKLGRKKNVGVRQISFLRRRCETEQGRSRMESSPMPSNKLSRLDSKMQPLDKQQMKKKYCFLEELKDETIVNKMQNIMRGHPSLANTILLTK